MMTMAGKIPAFFLPVPGQSTKEVAAGSALPGHAEHGLVGVQVCGRRVVCGLCRASILAGLALMQATVLMGGGYLKKVRDNIMESPISSKKLTRFDTTLTGCFERDISRVGHRHFK